ncbi:hypothetical protein [Pantoea cypripedii]|nr:hypothetical protein [Pantoea cypripedii]
MSRLPLQDQAISHSAGGGVLTDMAGSEIMKAWLVSFLVEWQGVCSEHHVLIRSHDSELAEVGVMHMGRVWWRSEARESDGCYWCFGRCNDVWFTTMLPLPPSETGVLTSLVFLDEWTVTGTPDVPEVCGGSGCKWEEFRD